MNFLGSKNSAMALVAAMLMGAPLAVQAQSPVLESAELTLERSAAWLQGAGIEDAGNGVAVYKLTYWTPNLQGNSALATAALVVPQTSCEIPLVAFIHGTMFLKSDAPSAWNDDAGSKPIGYTLGAYGFACVLPDLLGLGSSPGRHPYLNARVNARTTIDAVRAAREFMEQQNAPLNDQLFLMGSSAGSHTSLATTRMIQEEYADEFTVSATAGINGPYAVSPVLRDVMLEDQVNNGGANVVYMLLGYQAAYPGLFNSVSSFLASPYKTTLPPLYNGMHSVFEIIPQLPAVPADLLPAALRQELADQPDSPLNQKLRENSVFDWTPGSPVRLCYCSSDHMVPPENSLIAYDSLTAHGDAPVELVEMSSTASHGECAQLGKDNVIAWFRSLKVDCNGTTVGISPGAAQAPALQLHPNPLAGGTLHIDLSGLTLNEPGNAMIALVDARGRTVQQEIGRFGPNTPRAALEVQPGLDAGLYSVVVTLPGHRLVQRLVLAH